MDGRLRYYGFFGTAQVCGLIGIILLIYGIIQYKKLSWDIEYRFNVHPFMMMLGMVYLHGTAISAFRTLSNVERIYVKYLHAFLHTAVCALTVVGLMAVFNAKDAWHSPHLVSFHGWLGLFIVIFYFAQWFFSLLGFLYPKASENVRRFMMPYHRAFGALLFVLATVNSLIGLNGFIFGNNIQLKVWIPVLLFFFGILTVVSVRNKNFKRENIND